MTRKWVWGLLWILTITAVLEGQSRESLLKAVQETPGWQPVDKPLIYDEKNIEALAGKRALPIVLYGFTGATVQEWQGPSGKTRLTLFEMVDAAAAYGLFTLDRDVDQPGFATIPVGTEGFRQGNRAEFWQSNYVVRVEGAAAITDELARIVSHNIFGRSRKPSVSALLPPANIVRGSDRYVVDASGVSRELKLDAEKLGFDDSVEIATADYDIDGKKAHLVLLMYPTQHVAKKYADQWDISAPDGTTLRKRVGALVAIVRGSKDPAMAKTILDGVNYETQVTWDEPRPDISISQVILTIFSFIGIALLFTVVAGLSFGGLRIFVKARYPDRVFDRREDMEIIQLKLAQGVMQKQLHE